MSTKKYVSLSKLSTFLVNLRNIFAEKEHEHDSSYDLRGSANKAYENAKLYIDTVASGKSDTSHNHDNKYDSKGSASDALASAKSYTDTKTSGLASTSSVSTSISTHNTSTSAHSDIRALVTDLTTKLNNFLDVDDTTTDQLSEVITLINNNKGTLESLTTSKINVSDIVNNLTTSSTSKVLSAAQGVAIKGLIDALQEAVDGKASSGHSHTITATATDDDVIVLTGTNGTNKVTFDAKHATSGVTAGTYKSVTVNAYGHVTGGSNPTTLSGYGITDAYTKTQIDSALSGKANATHTHAITDVSGLQTALDGKAASSHGTHVTYSTTAPVMDGTASVGTATTVARSDHKHPTDTSRASKTEFDTHAADTTKHITSTERTNWGTAYTHSQTAHAPSNAEKNQNAFSNVKVGTTTVAADTTTDTLEIAAGVGISVAGDATNDKVTITNSGVIAVSTGSTNGTISVNTNGTSANVAVKGLGSAAYTNSSAYATAGHTHTVDSALSSSSTNPVQNKVVNSVISTLTSTVSANTSSISGHTTAISNLQTAVSEIQEITSAEIQALFA